MIQSLNIPPQHRYERKFVLSNIPKSEMVQRIKLHPALFREIFHTRRINNVYYDTEDLQFFEDNRIGIADRKKIRVRWYGETFSEAKNPKLEYKIKAGLLGDKYTFPLKPAEIAMPLNGEQFQENVLDNDLPNPVTEELKKLRPTLLNSYSRSYYQSADKKFRLTIDENLTYYKIDRIQSNFVRKHVEENLIILEMKYAPENDRLAGKISGAFPNRLDKSSKYVTGLEYWERK